MGKNLPDDVSVGHRRAPWNREPPNVHRKAMEVTLDVVIEVPENAPSDHERGLIKKAIDRGDYQLIDHKTAELLEVKKP